MISCNEFNEHSGDVIVIGITFNISKDKYTVSLSNNDLEEGKLIDLCCIKVESILRLEKNLVIKKIGKIGKNKFDDIISVLKTIIK